MNRAPRIARIALGTLLLAALGLVWPIVARGDAVRRVLLSNAAVAWLPQALRLPVVLAAGSLVAGVVVWRMTLGADARTPRLRIPTVLPLARGPRGLRTRLRDLPGMLRGAAIVLGFVALARPQDVLRGEDADERGIDIVVVLDMSFSMRALMDVDEAQKAADKRLTRLETAKQVILDFVSRRKSDRIGVVVFGRQAFILSPPTLDKSLLAQLVSRMELGLVDGQGTAIGDAVGTGVARLRRSNARSKAIILLTDGDSNAGAVAPEYAAHLAQTQGVRVYTVQIGNGDDVDVQDAPDIFGQPRTHREHFPVNPELLRKIASDTGGASFIAADRKSLEQSFHTILDALEKTRFEAQAATMEDLFPLVLVPAVVLLALEAIVRVFLLRRFP